MRSLILGYGYTGKVLKELLKGSDVVTTSRGDRAEIQFDLKNEETWSHLPSVDQTFWLFSAEPYDLVQKFYQVMHQKLGKMVVVGSTSGFLVEKPGQVVSETSPLDLSIERVRSEEWLRSRGASIVRASGIYGPARDPRRWYNDGRIRAGGSFLNLIHVEDLAQILLGAIAFPQAGTHFLASDFHPYLWKEIVAHLKLGRVDSFQSEICKKDSKRIDSSWSLNTLKIQLRYPSLLEGISSL